MSGSGRVWATLLALLSASCSDEGAGDAGTAADCGTDCLCQPASDDAAHAMISDLLFAHAGTELAILRDRTTSFGEPDEEEISNLKDTFDLSPAVSACAVEEDAPRMLGAEKFGSDLDLLLMPSEMFDGFADGMGPFEPNTDNVFAASFPVVLDDKNQALLVYTDFRTPGLERARRIAFFEKTEERWELMFVDFVAF